MDDCVDGVETCSYQAMGQGRPVYLFLRDVSHIDEHGRSLLSRLARKGVRLSASGVYSSYIVAEIGKGQPQPSDRRSRVAARTRNNPELAQAREARPPSRNRYPFAFFLV